MMHEPDVIDDFCKSDDDFHELLMSTLPNKYLRSAYDRITGLNTRFRIMTGKVSMINREQTCEEHLEILEPALKGDWNTAADALQKHLEIPVTRLRASSRSSGCGEKITTKDLSVSNGAGRSFFTQEGKMVENDPPKPI